MLLPFLPRSKPPPSSLTLPTTQVDLKAFIYQQERTFTKPHQLPGNYLPQDLQAGPGTPDIGYQEGNPVTKSGKKKKRRKKAQVYILQGDPVFFPSLKPKTHQGTIILPYVQKFVHAFGT